MLQVVWLKLRGLVSEALGDHEAVMTLLGTRALFFACYSIKELLHADEVTAQMNAIHIPQFSIL